MTPNMLVDNIIHAVNNTRMLLVHNHFDPPQTHPLNKEK